MQIHPVVEMFPRLNELELSKLVALIKDTGQPEPVICQNGRILDGCDIFYACGIVGIIPQVEEYSGPDPIAFLVERNLARHDLNPSQRALIAAQMTATPKRRGYASKLRSADEVTLPRAAELMSVSEATISLARRVLAEGNPEQLAAVRAGYASVNKLGHTLRAWVRPRDRKPTKQAAAAAAAESQEARNETVRLQTQMWAHLRDALTQLGELPLPSEVVIAARRQDRGLIDRRLEKSIKWLEEFRDEWRTRNGHEDAA